MVRRPLIFLALFTATSGCPDEARAARPRVALVPFDTVVGYSARQPVMSAVERALADRGYEVVTGQPIEAFLATERIRYLDSMAARQAEKLARAVDAEAVVLGTILAYDARAQERDPAVAVSAKLVSATGDVLWSNVVSMTSAETETALTGARVETVERLAARVASSLMRSAPTRLTRSWVEPSLGRLSSLPEVFRPDRFLEERRTICVMPLANLTSAARVPRIIDALVLHRLTQKKMIDVVEPGDLRAAIVANGLLPPWQMRPDEMRKLASVLGTRYVLGGAVFRYDRGSNDGADVEIYLSLTDVESGRVLWSGLHRRTGSEFEGLLRRGALTNPESVADRVVAEMIEAFTRS